MFGWFESNETKAIKSVIHAEINNFSSNEPAKKACRYVAGYKVKSKAFVSALDSLKMHELAKFYVRFTCFSKNTIIASAALIQLQSKLKALKPEQLLANFDSKDSKKSDIRQTYDYLNGVLRSKLPGSAFEVDFDNIIPDLLSMIEKARTKAQSDRAIKTILPLVTQLTVGSDQKKKTTACFTLHACSDEDFKIFLNDSRHVARGLAVLLRNFVLCSHATNNQTKILAVSTKINAELDDLLRDIRKKKNKDEINAIYEILCFVPLPNDRLLSCGETVCETILNRIDEAQLEDVEKAIEDAKEEARKEKLNSMVLAIKETFKAAIQEEYFRDRGKSGRVRSHNLKPQNCENVLKLVNQYVSDIQDEKAKLHTEGKITEQELKTLCDYFRSKGKERLGELIKKKFNEAVMDLTYPGSGKRTNVLVAAKCFILGAEPDCQVLREAKFSEAEFTSLNKYFYNTAHRRLGELTDHLKKNVTSAYSLENFKDYLPSSDEKTTSNSQVNDLVTLYNTDNSELRARCKAKASELFLRNISSLSFNYANINKNYKFLKQFALDKDQKISDECRKKFDAINDPKCRVEVYFQLLGHAESKDSGFARFVLGAQPKKFFLEKVKQSLEKVIGNLLDDLKVVDIDRGQLYQKLLSTQLLSSTPASVRPKLREIIKTSFVAKFNQVAKELANYFESKQTDNNAQRYHAEINLEKLKTMQSVAPQELKSQLDATFKKKFEGKLSPIVKNALENIPGVGSNVDETDFNKLNNVISVVPQNLKPKLYGMIVNCFNAIEKNHVDAYVALVNSNSEVAKLILAAPENSFCSESKAVPAKNQLSFARLQAVFNTVKNKASECEKAQDKNKQYAALDKILCNDIPQDKNLKEHLYQLLSKNHASFVKKLRFKDYLHSVLKSKNKTALQVIQDCNASMNLMSAYFNHYFNSDAYKHGSEEQRKKHEIFNKITTLLVPLKSGGVTEEKALALLTSLLLVNATALTVNRTVNLAGQCRAAVPILGHIIFALVICAAWIVSCVKSLCGSSKKTMRGGSYTDSNGKLYRDGLLYQADNKLTLFGEVAYAAQQGLAQSKTDLRDIPVLRTAV